MSIFSRTRDIVAANMADLLTRSEDPAKTIRVIILEMEETLVDVRALAARSIADIKERNGQRAAIARLQDNWSDRAALALERGREDLARAALLEKEKLGALGDQLADEIASLDQGLRASEADIAKLQAKLREARGRQAAIAARMQNAEARLRVREAYAGERTADALAKFELLEREADLIEGKAEALALAAPRSLQEEIAELKLNDKVEAELAALKARSLPAAA